MNISRRAQNISPSATLAISARAKKMQEETTPSFGHPSKEGNRVINFTVGEPDFDTPDYIIEAAKRALDAGHTKYTACAGILPLRKAICEKLKRDNGLDYAPNQIVVSTGAKQALANAILAIVNPGDEVIIPVPYWVTYPELVKFAGGMPVFVEGISSIKKSITSKTKAIIINSPNNPTGAVYTETELRALATSLRAPRSNPDPIYVISDEVYEKLIYRGKHFSIATCHDNTIVINGFSKSHAMTGWRIGYSASSVEVATAIDNIQSHTTSNVNTIMQHAAVEALQGSGGEKFLKDMLAEFDKRRKYMVERINKMPKLSCNTPDGAFYIMVKTNVNAEQLLEHARIATVPGEAFGAPGYLRFCYTVSMDDIKEGMNRLEKFLNTSSV